MNENMALWNAVFMTDPSAVKPITGKSYSGNSPKPYWLIQQATKQFGACGIGWGVEVVSSTFQQCSPDDWLHTAIVRVWYIQDGKKGVIEQAGGTKAAYKTSSGKVLVDEDAAKKSVTDGMVKCLSMIGFAGDIFSGRWDDSKYVHDAAAYFQEQARIEAMPFCSDAALGKAIKAILEGNKDAGKSLRQIRKLTEEQTQKLIAAETQAMAGAA